MAINPFPRVNPLEIPTALPSGARAPEGTFNNIASIGDAIGTYRTHQQVADAIRAASDESGAINFDQAAANLGKAGLPQYIEPFLNAAARRQALQQTGAAQSETARHNLQLEDIARTSKVPYGWMQGPDGSLMPAPGGPASLEYLEKTAQLKEKPRQFSVNDVTKLSEEGGKFSQLAGFGNTFQDKYAGYVNPMVGGAAMTAGRYLPEGVVGKDIAESAGFWQGYDRFKNVTRNELYGAALTVNEQKAFEQADINPAMQPSQIRNNLKIQQDIVRNGLKRKANALISSGYDPVAISQAYGLDLKELGVDASGRRGTVAPAAPATSAPGGNIPPPPPGFIMR